MSEAPRPRLTIPAYDIALTSFVLSVMDGLIDVDPVLGQIGSRATGHSGPIRNVPGPKPVDQPLTTFKDRFVIHADVIRDTNVEEFVSALAQLAQRQEEALGRTLFQTLREVTEATGNAINAEGQPLSWDLFLDLLERVEFSFDEDGRPHPTQVLMNPETAKQLFAIEVTPEQRQRHDDIVRRKKERWDAQKRTRRLPRRDPGTGV